MADVKISELPAATDLTGADFAGIQSSTTKKFPESLFQPAIKFFQVEDDGTTGQTTNGTFTTLAGMWGTPSQTDSAFSWVGSTGILTVNTTGKLELNINVMAHQSTGNNRTQLEIRVTKNGTSTVLIAAENYTQRNLTQDKGGCSIPGFIDSVTATDTYRLQVRDIGTLVDVGSSFVAGETYISAKLYT